MTTTQTTATAGLFDALTADELKALSDAIVTRRPRDDGLIHGGQDLNFSSNRMTRMLAGRDDALYLTYLAVASEISDLHSEISSLFIAQLND